MSYIIHPIHHLVNDRSRWLKVLISVGVLTLAFLLGQRASPAWLVLVAAGISGLVLLAMPALGMFALTAAALLIPLEIRTGTAVNLNAAALLIPVLAIIWLLDMIRKRRVHVVPSRTNLPLLLFLAAGLLSLLIGRATWDPQVTVTDNFLLVQLAQWAIFAFSALAFWLAANLITDETNLRRLTAFYLLLSGSVAILHFVPVLNGLVSRIPAGALLRAPLWVLLTALGGGQLLFNRELSQPWRLFLALALTAALVYGFIEQRQAVSSWTGLAAVLGALIWLRFPRLRWFIAIVIIMLLVIGVLFPGIYQFAGGDAEWEGSGAPRLLLIERVVSVTMRNPITGLGPAAYRPYANATPLKYLNAYWIEPKISSHNNYVDLFAHQGMVGLLLFGWFAWELAHMGLRLRKRCRHGFSAGYINGMLAVGTAAVILMLLADWVLPFVYNVGFPGFQASVLVWLFMGGLVALERSLSIADSKSTLQFERDGIASWQHSIRE